MPKEYRGKGVHQEGTWRAGFECVETFVAQQRYTGVPEWIVRLIWRGMTEMPGVAEAKAEIAEAIRRVPDYETFLREVKSLRKRSAPGFSGLDYNMIKSWPDELLRVVYDDLAAQWSKREIPDWWRWRWLCPIPKKSTGDDLNNLRPLMLNETIRKLWCRVIFKPIQRVWDSYGLLSPCQHGGTRRRGTDTASIEFINMLEEAYQSGTMLFMSSWDMKRAFDAVSVGVKQMAWFRMGVPEDAVEYLSSLDQNDVTVVRTPLTADVWRREGYAGLDHRGLQQDEGEDENRGFSAERGTGQGDVLSPPLWIAVFDILLRSLALVSAEHKEDDIKLSAVGGGGYQARDQGYMDDLFSSALSVEGLQRKADVVSGFCVIFGIKISEGKLRRMIMNGSDQTCPLKVHGMGWVQLELSEEVSDHVTNLGVVYENDISGRREVDKAIAEIERTAMIIRNTRASADIKCEIMERCILLKLVYSAKFCSIPLAEYRKIDKIMDAFYRAATKNLFSFPGDLLHVDKQRGGLGFRRFSDVVQQEKWGMLRRAIYGDEVTRLAIRSMVLRGGVGGDVGGDYSGFATVGGSSRSYWVSSLIEWAAEAGLYLHWKGLGDGGGANEMWVTQNMKPGESATAAASGVQVVGDVAAITGLGMRWCVPVSIKTDRAWDIKNRKVVEGGVALRAGQFWRRHRKADVFGQGPIMEVVGLKDMGGIRLVKYRHWRKGSEGGLSHHPSPTLLSMTYGEMLDCTLYRVLVGPEVRRGPLSDRGVISDHRAVPPLWPSPKESLLGGLVIAGDPLSKMKIFTDGSWHYSPETADEIFMVSDKRGSGTGGLVIWDGVSDRIVTLQVGGVEAIGAKSAHTVEYLMMALGMKVSRLRGNKEQVKGDCLGVIDGLRVGIKKATKGGTTHCVLLDDMLRSRAQGVPIVQWTKSHPEREKVIGDFTTDEMGIYLADKVAGDEWDDIADGGFRVQRFNIPAAELYEELVEQGDWYWGDAAGKVMPVCSLFEHVRDYRAASYIKARDGYREKGGREPYWFDNTMRLAAVVWRLVSGRVMHRARNVRFMWDWHRHGGNRAKGAKGGDAEELGACDVCGSPDSQSHWISDCAHPELVKIRQGVYAELQAIARNSQTAEELRSVAQFLFDRIPEADSRRYWVSNWCAGMRNEFHARLKGRGYGGKRTQRAIIHCGQILARGVSSLWSARKVVAEASAAGKELSAKQMGKLVKLRVRQEKAERQMAMATSKGKGLTYAATGKMASLDGLGFVEVAKALHTINVQSAAARRRKKFKSLTCTKLQGRKRKAEWAEMCDPSGSGSSKAVCNEESRGMGLERSGFDLPIASDYSNVTAARDGWWARQQLVAKGLRDDSLESAVQAPSWVS